MARVPGLLRCWIESYDAAAVVYARGEVDLSSAAVLRRCLDRAHQKGRAVVVDLRNVTYLDGTGFRVLEDAYQRSREQERPFWVVPSRNVRRLVTLLNLEDAVPLAASVEDAIDKATPPD